MVHTSGAGPVPLSPKAHNFLLTAVDEHIRRMQAQLDDPGVDDDSASDLTNDLTLYKLIYDHLRRQGPLPG